MDFGGTGWMSWGTDGMDLGAQVGQVWGTGWDRFGGKIEMGLRVRVGWVWGARVGQVWYTGRGWL